MIRAGLGYDVHAIGVGGPGRGDGLAAHAVVLVERV